jgi:hypothetical protein
MSETISAANAIQQVGLFASEVQQLLDVITGYTPLDEWKGEIYHRIPIMVDAKELERQGRQPSKRVITKLCSRLARDQLVFLSEEDLIQMRWIISRLNPSDIGTKLHSSIITLRKLCGMYQPIDSNEIEFKFVPLPEIKEMIDAFYHALASSHRSEQRDIDYFLKVRWEIEKIPDTN